MSLGQGQDSNTPEKKREWYLFLWLQAIFIEQHFYILTLHT